ncbi:MAG: hypothetical protein Fur0043_04850 [Anaerolineales bacterium]
MRIWSLGEGDPLFLTLAADARLAAPNYVDDHIWELELAGGEPPALALRTTYGLRARSMRVFPRFTEAGRAVSAPADFAVPPRLCSFYPNFLELTFSPFAGLEVTYEVRVPQSNVIAGRVSISNRTTASRTVQLEMCGALVPLDGHALTPTQIQMVNVLVGQTSGLVPLLFLTGGPLPGPGPLPSLMVNLDLGPGASRQLTWALASTDAHQASFDAARLIAARPWDAERARIELINAAGMLDIYTSDPDWDAALVFSQMAAYRLFFPPGGGLPFPSFVRARGPDQGYSRSGDGSDHPSLWAGSSPLDAYYLVSTLPAAPGLAKGILRNYLSTQAEDGMVDNQPGLGGQRAHLHAMPLLASLAWNLFCATGDEPFLVEVFPKLMQYFWAWFSPHNDRDRDGLPEWSSPFQTGYEDNPMFSLWHSWAQGAEVGSMRHPALLSMLYREAQVLLKMAARLERQDETRLIQKQAETLKSVLQAAWDARAALYRYCDRETGASLPGKILARQRGPGTLKPKQTFEPPVRLLIEVQTKGPAVKRPHVVIGEYVTKGESEVLPPTSFQWKAGGMVATSQRVHSKIGRIEIKGVDASDKVIIRSLDYTSEDHTLLTPLWAGVPDLQQAQAMIGRAVLDAARFDRPFGLPACPLLPTPKAASVNLAVSLPWNQLICEGLLAYGFRTEAARLFARLMNGIIQNLKHNRAFYQYYHAESGAGLGERNALSGLAPLGLFLRILGVQIVSPTRVRLEGKNPFPWPVTIQYRALKIVRGLEDTEITFPNGKTAVVKDSNPVIVAI